MTTPNTNTPQLVALLDVAAERRRQDELFPGPDGFPSDLRLDVLTEEVGEVAKARLEHLRDGAPLGDLRVELVQVAATAVRWVEQIDAEGRA